MRKIIISARLAPALVVIFTLYTAIFAQIETNGVPAKWEYYSGKDKKVSFLLPRLPVYVAGGVNCQGESTETYAAYHDGVVYRVDITSRIEPSKLCVKKQNFDENNFTRRLASLKTNLKDETDSQANISNNSVIKLTGENKITKLVNDYQHKRWFELSIYGADENKPEVKNFLASLKTDWQSAGIAIGEGASQTWGDDVPPDAEVKNQFNLIDNGKVQAEETVTQITLKIKDTTTKNFTVALKPRAPYTDAARQKKVQGTVVLRVNFMANGATGTISVVRGLSDGLTEEAVKAAQKMVFIPPQKDGERLTVSKTVEYGFTLY